MLTPWFIRTALVSMFLAGQTALLSAQEVLSVNTYTDSQYGFSFDFPANWIHKPPRSNPNAIVKVSSNQSDRANCYVESRRAVSGAGVVRAIQTRSSEYRVIHQGKTLLGGETAEYREIAAVYPDFDTVIRIRHLLTWTRVRDQTFLISCGSFADHFEFARPQFMRIIESIRFIPRK